MDTNTVVFSGRLISDLEQRFTTGGKPVVNGCIAVNKYFPKDKQPTKEEREKTSMLINFQAWGSYTASKGDTVCIIGKLASYESNTGERRYKVEVNSDGIYIKSKQAKQENQTDDDWSIP